jgi:hypothetical protein
MRQQPRRPEESTSVNSLAIAAITAKTMTLPNGIDGHRVRVGCDVLAIQDVADSVATFGDRYLRKVFTSGEIDDCQGHYFHGLAARFAAKEAVIKAFADPDMPFPLREIEITRQRAIQVLDGGPIRGSIGVVQHRTQHAVVRHAFSQVLHARYSRSPVEVTEAGCPRAGCRRTAAARNKPAVIELLSYHPL